MKYNLNINQHNIKPHLDIEQDIQDKKDGLFTFNLRVSQGNIEDYGKFKTVTFAKYGSFTIETFQESVATHNLGEGSDGTQVRTDKR